jgi:hypothetical protein
LSQQRKCRRDDKDVDDARCAFNGCRKWRVAGSGEYCTIHERKQQAENAPQLADASPPIPDSGTWVPVPFTNGVAAADLMQHRFIGLSASSEGSGGVVFVVTEAGTYVVKGGDSVAQESFAGMLASKLNIPVPPQILLARGGKGYDELIELLTLNAPRYDAELSQKVNSLLDKPCLLLLQFTQGSTINSLGDSINPILSTDSAAGFECFRQLGQILAFDVICNNSDRAPAIWDNEGIY